MSHPKLAMRFRLVASVALFSLAAAAGTATASFSDDCAAHDAQSPTTNSLSGYIIAVG
jgi:hypothetical protein